ncbi:MAG: ATP-dependent helicase HrpB, partial [Chromatiales bacterium]|nr:ATP-dependent helicase HrpB [Chromatiales bacterium]
AGRLGPGSCYRLWTKAVQSQLAVDSSPEILDTDLTGLVLELAQWGVSEPAQLSWLDPPPPGAYAQSVELLCYLGALDSQRRVTTQGAKMVQLGVHPRLAHMLLEAAGRGQLGLAADIAAILTEKEMFLRSKAPNSIDIEDRLQVLARWREMGKSGIDRGIVDLSACRQIEQSSRQMGQRVERVVGQKRVNEKVKEQLSIGGLLALAFPDRVALCKSRERGSYQLVLGRRALVPEGDPLAGRECLVVAHLDAGRSEGRIFLAAQITLAEVRELEADNIYIAECVEWRSQSRSVVAHREERLGNLVLSERPLRDVDPVLQAQALLNGVRELGLSVLPWNDEANQLRQRLRFLHHHQSNADWPDLADDQLLATLDDWLSPWLTGISRADQLKRLNLRQIMLSLLSWEQQQALDELAPTHFGVPSGSRKRIDYSDLKAPVLAVRLQEMFGCVDTPRICKGEVALLIHLLSPAQRPIQVTQDLAGFWARTYESVKKELKGRYPKHYWPDDPLVAEPTHRVKPRRV